MNSSHLDAFIEAIKLDNPAQAKEALQRGLGQELGFNYDNARVWGGLMQIKSLEVLNAVLSQGFTLEAVKEIAQISSNPIIINLVSEAEIIIEKEKLQRGLDYKSNADNLADKSIHNIIKI